MNENSNLTEGHSYPQPNACAIPEEYNDHRAANGFTMRTMAVVTRI
jgi:hypothetical protein